MGGSAGGLLMGVVINQAPELFLGIIMAVPFVDSLTTNLDHSLPLTVGEFEEILSKIVTQPEEKSKTSKDSQGHHPKHNKHQTNLAPQTSFDLIYFDGHHTKEATLKYFKQLLPTAHNDTVFVFDDIHWSAEMEEAWGEIKWHPEVRVTIDTFFLGLVFFRKEQAKQHFTIRL